MNLFLHVRGEYFDEIKRGDKVEEYRLYNSYWKKRLEGRMYDKRDYPSTLRE